MESREVIQSKIDILWKVLLKIEIDNYPNSRLYDELKKEQLELQIQFLDAKSIEDIERESFEAGQKGVTKADGYYFKYETFEDYLKSKDSNN